MKICFLIHEESWEKHSVVHGCLFHLLFNKGSVPLGENSSNRNYFIDGKHSMDNFNTTESHRFSWLGKLCMHKKATVKSHSNEKE